MKRATTSRILGSVLALSAVLLAGCGASDSRSAANEGVDSVWYHESDVALIGATGRPQLVEFFHPG